MELFLLSLVSISIVLILRYMSHIEDKKVKLPIDWTDSDGWILTGYVKSLCKFHTAFGTFEIGHNIDTNKFYLHTSAYNVKQIWFKDFDTLEECKANFEKNYNNY